MAALPPRHLAGAVAAAAALALALPGVAHAAEPLPVPLPDAASTATTATSAAPSPTPAAPSPTPGPLEPVLSELPAPVAEPLREVVGLIQPAPPPQPGPQPAPQPAPGRGVGPNAGTPPQQVESPRTGTASLAALRSGSLRPGGARTSGLPPLAAGSAAASLDTLFSVPDIAAPLPGLPQAAPAAARPGSVPPGLPGLVVVLALMTVGGATAGQIAVMRARRTAAA